MSTTFPTSREEGVRDVLRHPQRYGLRVVDPTRHSRGRPEALRLALAHCEFMYSIQSISSTAKVIRRLKLALKELSVEDVSQGMEELQRLRAFAQAVMESWPDGDVEGGHLQSMAVTHGLLVEITRQEPCGDGCRCAETEHEEDWRDGVRCFRKTPLLIGLTKEVT